MKHGRAIITTSWDDGHPLDTKLCSILKENGIPGTIYAPITNWENEVMSKEALKGIAKDFEIGGHTYNHTILTLVDEEKVAYELVESKRELEQVVGKEIISFCYPRGQYTPKIMQQVQESGYKGGRTAELLRTTIARRYEYHPTVQAVDRILLSKGKQIITTDNHSLAAKLIISGDIFKRWNVIAKRTLDHVLENGEIWHLWGHSWEIDMNGDWQLLREVLEYAKARGKEYGAEFLTNGTIFEEQKA